MVTTVYIEVQCLTCYSVWRIEHEIKDEQPALRADLLTCPLCFDESE